MGLNPGITISFQCFTPEEVKEINKRIKKNIFKEQIPEAAAENVSKVGQFYHVQCAPLMELVHPWLYESQRLNNNFFGFDIWWNFHLDGFNYNVYEEGGEYGWHMDSNPNVPFDMKLTCLLNLSEEPYEGGEFCTINQEGEIKFDSGMGLIINSLVAHKVTPVTKGERITLTYWGMGNSWR